MESLVAPSARISPGFGIATYTLKDGSVVSGAPLQENATKVVVRLPEGGERSFARSDVVSSTPAVSVMPPMLGILTHEEIRDVVAYLSTLKPRSTKKK